MPNVLVLEEVTDQGHSELARLESGEIVVGRSPDDGLSMKGEAISREHGVFRLINENWFYHDLGSTNGSWLNSKRLIPNIWALLRDGDYMQLADLALQVRFKGNLEHSMAGFPTAKQSSIIVFSDTQYIEERPIAEYGRIISIGGSSGDFDIRGDVAEESALIIERRGEKVCAFQISEQTELKVNGEPVNTVVELADRDEVRVAEFVILINTPPRSAHQATPVNQEPDMGSLRGWGNEKTSPDIVPTGKESFQSSSTTASGSFGTGSFGSTGTFGTGGFPESEHNSEETVSIDPMGTVAGADLHPSARRALEDATGSYSFQSVEDKVILVIGLLLMVLLGFLVVWWVFAT